ncbi:hypothetical protein MKK75_02590 [Methylobacterium sp. J-030]|uniref:hypothetical protein n=1 Tax=Methylobacterium sp. J-030 TaxID=2836627 RepID=UPI001FB8AF2C|nr:hypothetical protein [Methylobacterium sp. J-030]MCJ2067701.1 hypothetical protein [Methylobacterium sp. J-030]
MVDDGPPLKFVALWGMFAVLMLFGQMQLINHGANIALSYQIDPGVEPTLMAALD